MGISKKLETIYHNGQPDGIRSIRRSLSTMTTYVIPRPLLSEAKNITGINRHGIYYLINESEDNRIAQIYIGQTRNGILRLDDHNRSKDFWNKAIMFLAESKTFTLDMISGLEKYAIIKAQESKRYMHQYNFPPYCTGETGRMGAPKRREIGHGALAERALLPVLPSEDEFPYAIRVVSEIMESNGSSSMASTCGSTLALMDAGVPIKAPVSGIAMGLIKEGDDIVILSDIQGLEDFLGDMDFKVTGTEKGITALQMDNKAKGLSTEILGRALKQAKAGRHFILQAMLAEIAAPREELRDTAPRIDTIHIAVDKIREVIGKGGETIRGIQDSTGATIEIQEDGTVHIASVDQEAGKAARAAIEAIVKVPEVGEVYEGPVVGIQSFGAFIKLTPSKDGLLHISRMANGRVGQVEDVLSMGDMVKVQVIEIDPKSGKISLDRLEKPDAPEGSALAPRHERGDREDRGERRDRGEKTDHRPGRSNREANEHRTPRRRH